MILSIDTSTRTSSVAIAGNDGSIIKEIYSECASSHSEVLFEQILKLSATRIFDFNNLSKVVCTTGPGSFTGIRIGMLCARTIAHIYRLPLLGISTLELLAYQLAGKTIFSKKENNFICPVISSNKEEIYTAVYKFVNHTDKLKKIINHIVIAGKDLKKLFSGILSRTPNYRIYFTGDFCIENHSLLKELFTNTQCYINKKDVFPRASILAAIASKRKGNTYERIKPTYLKSPRIF